MNKRNQIYNELSTLLTDYEEFDDKGNDIVDYMEWADSLYQMLVTIQRNWEDVITAQEK